MAKLLSSIGAALFSPKTKLLYLSEVKPVFLSLSSRYIALPVVTTKIRETNRSGEVLRPLAREQETEQEAVLAGDPQSVSGIRQEIREEILRRWNQKPKVDMSREWLKYAIHD